MNCFYSLNKHVLYNLLLTCSETLQANIQQLIVHNLNGNSFLQVVKIIHFEIQNIPFVFAFALSRFPLLCPCFSPTLSHFFLF